MNDDLKDFHAPLGAFQLLEPDGAVAAICALGVFALIFWPWLAA